MSKNYLEEDGETRTIGGGRNRYYKVVAERVDNETGYIHVYQGKDLIATFWTGEMHQLAKDLITAEMILPVSK